MTKGKRALSLVLVIVIILSLFGCAKTNESEYQKDIVYTTDSEPSSHLGERAEEVLFGLLKYYVNKSGVQSIPEKTIKKLQIISKDIRGIIEKSPISDYSYSCLLDLLETQGYKVIDEIEEGEMSAKRQLYLDICSLLGEEYFGGLCFDILIYYYDYAYNDNIEKYEKYGYAYLLDDAEKMKSAALALTDHIGRDSFASVLSSGLAVIELLTFGGEGDFAKSFSNEEMLMFIQSIDLSFNIEKEGWEFILGSLLPGIFDGIGAEILMEMAENGDISILSERMTDMLLLLRKMQLGLSSSDMEYIRSGDREALAGAVFASLDDNGWQLFFDITELSLDFEVYETIFESEYGEDYLSYVDNLNAVSADQLRLSVGTEDFYESLEGYIGGISPAFSYGMNK